jgi:hypothetical protein
VVACVKEERNMLPCSKVERWDVGWVGAGCVKEERKGGRVCKGRNTECQGWERSGVCEGGELQGVQGKRGRVVGVCAEEERKGVGCASVQRKRGKGMY